MPKYKIKSLNFKKGKEYAGKVCEVVVNERKGRVWIFVELEEYPNERFLKSVKFSLTENSEFVRIAEELEAVDRRGNVDTETFEEQSVVVTMSQGDDGTWFVGNLWAAEEAADGDEDCIFDDEDSGDLFDDDDEDINFDED